MSLKIANDTANGSATLKASDTATGDVTHVLPAFSTELAPRMQLMTAQDTTSGTYVDFTGIPSWAKRITVMFNGVSTSGSSNLLLQIGENSIISNIGYVSGAVVGSGATTATNTTGYILTAVLAGADGLYGTATLEKISEFKYMQTGTVVAAVGSIRLNSSGGEKTLSNALNILHLTTVNGTDTFDAGTVNVLVEG